MAKTKLRMRLVRWLKRCLQVIGLIMILLAGILLIGLIPVNNGFQHSENGISVYLTSSAVHADIIVPISSATLDWRTEFPAELFTGPIDNATHVAFGWGDRGFFVATPTWNDLNVMTAANALLIPTGSCVHVAFTRAEVFEGQSTLVKLAPDQYQRLVGFIKSTFKTDDLGRRTQITGGAYHENDAFFDAIGHYHALNTCNSWTGRAMKSAGVRVPLLTPLPGTPVLYLPDINAVPE